MFSEQGVSGDRVMGFTYLESDFDGQRWKFGDHLESSKNLQLDVMPRPAWTLHNATLRNSTTLATNLTLLNLTKPNQTVQHRAGRTGRAGGA